MDPLPSIANSVMGPRLQSCCQSLAGIDRGRLHSNYDRRTQSSTNPCDLVNLCFENVTVIQDRHVFAVNVSSHAPNGPRLTFLSTPSSSPFSIPMPAHLSQRSSAKP